MIAIGSPNNIDVLLHYHCSQFPHPRIHAPAVVEAVLEFASMGVLEVTGESDDAGNPHYRTTRLGAAWVQALCNVPPPRPAFIDQNGKVF